MKNQIYFSVPVETNEVVFTVIADTDDANSYCVHFMDSKLASTRIVTLSDEFGNVIETLIGKYDDSHENEFEMEIDDEDVAVNIQIFMDNNRRTISVSY